MKTEIKVASHNDIHKQAFGLLSFMFSDIYLSAEFVMKQLQTWSSNSDYSVVFIVTNPNLDLKRIIENAYKSLPKSLLNKICDQFSEKDCAYVSVQERMVCFYCKNIGSIILCRTNASIVRFVCEECHINLKTPTQFISDLIWSRRCNEYSSSRANTQSLVLKNIQVEIKESIGSIFDLIPAMMILKKDESLNILTLSTLFTTENFRKEGLGEKLIKFIPSLGNNMSISICTAGLESEYLFSKYLNNDLI